MLPVSEADIRSSFVNCSKGDAKRLSVPTALGTLDFENLDFLGWADATYAGRCYVVTPGVDDEIVGIALRRAAGGTRRAQMCTICLTTHPSGGVALMSAAKAGPAGRRGDTVGAYICADLACSAYARGTKTPSLGKQYKEDLDIAAKVTRVRENMAAFVARVVG
ncbi:FBP domain-containing protein [Williamsia deligens]|uniref:FBP domain-containing protein n=1 Tax=Williamsia deligens TaxID=321325 RepID=A0ABW3G6H0_9NOCA|nr:FBP domain-containing protein [Williamsia deligens]MCP2193067.1 FBP C-terminal treble-clef zinc-finger [Williamsia deligens]